MAFEKKKKTFHFRVWLLAFLDALSLLLTDFFILWINPSAGTQVPLSALFLHFLMHFGCILFFRLLLGVYRQIWRFGGSFAYALLIISDGLAGAVCYGISWLTAFPNITFIRLLAVFAMNLLICLLMRMAYQFSYTFSRTDAPKWRKIRRLIRRVMGWNATSDTSYTNKIKIAIAGAGAVGSMLAKELLENESAPYRPICFLDSDESKIGRSLSGIPVYSDRVATKDWLNKNGVQEIVVAIPSLSYERKRALYEKFKSAGFRVKLYDFPTAEAAEGGKRQMREFAIEDILFRPEKSFLSDACSAFYSGKTVLISGGGGSIGSELCRQIAAMTPKKLVVLDVYENGAYDIQQELKRRYGNALSIEVEIASVCDRPQLEIIFARQNPDIVLHAAAHKHVPLMEHNCCEAVRNNVFGTFNIVETAEKYGVSKFIMISTDKAVNPTNVMGATKRVCEMIVRSRKSNTSFSATRFGNVLGSNGSVIPLFKSQIAAGGPITLTDKRIIRYFMTIPEAAQLVLESGSMAQNGDLYVLDMGRPVKILELAENMIRLSGFEPYRDIDIREIGLRPGEKLYEELLIKDEKLGKTDNSMIFIERDAPLGQDVIAQKLDILRKAVDTGDDDKVRNALKEVVPTYHSPEEVNAEAASSKEMKNVL